MKIALIGLFVLMVGTFSVMVMMCEAEQAKADNLQEQVNKICSIGDNLRGKNYDTYPNTDRFPTIACEAGPNNTKRVIIVQGHGPGPGSRYEGEIVEYGGKIVPYFSSNLPFREYRR